MKTTTRTKTKTTSIWLTTLRTQRVTHRGNSKRETLWQLLPDKLGEKKKKEKKKKKKKKNRVSKTLRLVHALRW